MKIVSYKICPFVQRVTALLEAKNVDYDVEYIDEVMGVPISSDDPLKKAQDRAWSYLASKNYLVQCSAQRSPDSATLEECATKLSTAFRKIEARLGNDLYANGDSLGMIDIAWLPLLHRASILEKESGYDFLEAFPRVKRWQRDLLATGIAARSVADDFEDRFNAFYLAEETQLGQLARTGSGTTCRQPAMSKRDDKACCA